MTKEEYTKYYEKIEYIGEVKKMLEASYEELKEYRVMAAKMKKAYDNGFNHELGDTEKIPTVLRSSLIMEIVEIFKGGMSFPDWQTKPVLTNGAESISKASLAKAVLEWMIRETGFEGAWEDSKIPWALYGDSYRRPFKIKIGKNKWFPQYEEVEPSNLYLDVDAVDVWSKNSAKASSFWAYGLVLSEAQLRMKLGALADDLMPFIEEGVAIDIDQYSAKTAKTDTTRKKKYYEYIEVQDALEETECILVGRNLFPVKIQGKKAEKASGKIGKKALDAGVVIKKEYLHKDAFGRPTLTLHNTAFYYDRENIRNKGVGERMYRFQKADELLENSGLNATKMKALAVPYLIGGRQNKSQNLLGEWAQKRKSNVFAMLEVSSGMPGQTPELGVLKFDVISAEEMRVSKDDLKSMVRNYMGVAPNRLEVRQNEGLGQTKLIEAEKIKTVEDIVKKEKSKLENELRGLLLYFVNNKGFGLNDVEIEYTSIMEGVQSQLTGGDLGTITNNHEKIDLVKAAEKLKDFHFNVFVDMDTFVQKNNLSLMEDMIKVTGLIDPQATPGLMTKTMKALLDVAKIKYEDSDFENIEQSTPQGGVSQFKDGGGSVDGGTPSSQPDVDLSQLTG